MFTNKVVFKSRHSLLPSLVGTGVAGMDIENEGNQEHQLNIPRLNSLQDRSLSPNFLALWKTRVG
jgi:hypothetical protein